MKCSWIVKMALASFFIGMLFLLGSVSASMDEIGINTLEDASHFEELEKILFEEDPNAPDAYPKSYCTSCLEISRKAEKILNDPWLLKRIDFTFTTICKLVSSGFQEKCGKMVDMYKSDVIMFLQDAFLEENFCNNSGICSSGVEANLFSSIRGSNLVSSMLPFAIMLDKLWKELPTDVVKLNFNGYTSQERENPLMLQSNGTCVACIGVLEKMRGELEEPDKQLKIISTLLKACETEVFVNKCKKLIFAYGPIVITNIQKVLSMDLCHMVHICMKTKNHTNYHYGENSRQTISVTPTQIDMI